MTTEVVSKKSIIMLSESTDVWASILGDWLESDDVDKLTKILKFSPLIMNIRKVADYFLQARTLTLYLFKVKICLLQKRRRIEEEIFDILKIYHASFVRRITLCHATDGSLIRQYLYILLVCLDVCIGTQSGRIIAPHSCLPLSEELPNNKFLGSFPINTGSCTTRHNNEPLTDVSVNGFYYNKKNIFVVLQGILEADYPVSTSVLSFICIVHISYITIQISSAAAKIAKKKAETTLLVIGDECDIHKAQVFFSNSAILVKTFVRDALHACGGFWNSVEHTKEVFRIGSSKDKVNEITRDLIFAEYETKPIQKMIQEWRESCAK